MNRRLWAIACWAVLCGLCCAEEKSKFNENGERVADDDAKGRTLLQWADLATGSRAKLNRRLGTSSIKAISDKALRKEIALSDGEAAIVRQAGLRLLAAQEMEFRVNGAEILRPVVDKSCLRPLLAACADKSENAEDLQRHAAVSLESIATDACIPVLLKIGTDVKLIVTSRAAVATIAAIKTPKSREALETIEKNSTNAEVRDAAAAALDKLDGR